MSSERRPAVSVASAVSNVARYLPDFVASLEAQTRGKNDVEILIFDDGPTEESPKLFAGWAQRHPATVRVIPLQNGGQGAACNKRFYGSFLASLVKQDRVRERAPEFNGRFRPNFEHGYFVARYLLGEDHPLVGYHDAARYEYRSQAYDSYTRQTAQGHPDLNAVVLDLDAMLVKVSYCNASNLSAGVWRAKGDLNEPLHAKLRVLESHGRTLLHRPSVWLTANRPLQLDLRGAPVNIVYERPHGPVRVAPPGQIRLFGGPTSERSRQRIPKHQQIKKPESRQDKVAQPLMNTSEVRKQYADAWVSMDRVHDATDSGEILSRHQRANHLHVNALFVLEKAGGKWECFRKAPHRDRLADCGSVQCRLLLSRVKRLRSSQVDAVVEGHIDASFKAREGTCCECVIAKVRQNESNRSKLTPLPLPTMPETRSEP